MDGAQTTFTEKPKDKKMAYENKNFLSFVEKAREAAWEEPTPRKRVERLAKEIGEFSYKKAVLMDDKEISLWADFFCLNDRGRKLNRRRT